MRNEPRIRYGKQSRGFRGLEEGPSFSGQDYLEDWGGEEPRSSYFNRNVPHVGDREGRRMDRPGQRRYGSDRAYREAEFSDAGFYDDTEFEADYRDRSRGLHFGKGPKGWKRSDEAIKENACQALSDDSRVDATEIEVTVKDGVVHLRGTVDERRTKRRAEACVEDLSGVLDVINELRIHRESGNLKVTKQ